MNTLIRMPENIQNQEEYTFETPGADDESETTSELNGTANQKLMFEPGDKQEAEQDFSIYPNPLSNTATIQYYVKNDGMVNIKLYNTNGKLVETLVNKKEYQGSHQIQVNATHFEAGIYYVVFENDGQPVKVAKMVVLK